MRWPCEGLLQPLHAGGFADGLQRRDGVAVKVEVYLRLVGSVQTCEQWRRSLTWRQGEAAHPLLVVQQDFQDGIDAAHDMHLGAERRLEVTLRSHSMRKPVLHEYSSMAVVLDPAAALLFSDTMSA